MRKKCKPTWTSAKEWLDAESMGLLCPIGDDASWIRIEAMIDSGACDHVCPPEFAPDAPVIQTQISLAGKCLLSANGGKIKNLGRKDVTAYCITGQKTEMKLQVAENLKTALFSVSKLERSGNSIVFDKNGSYIFNHATATRTPIRQHNGAYMIDLWVQHSTSGGKVASVKEHVSQPEMNNVDDDSELGFPRLPYDWE